MFVEQKLNVNQMDLLRSLLASILISASLKSSLPQRLRNFKKNSKSWATRLKKGTTNWAFPTSTWIPGWLRTVCRFEYQESLLVVGVFNIQQREQRQKALIYNSFNTFSFCFTSYLNSFWVIDEWGDYGNRFFFAVFWTFLFFFVSTHQIFLQSVAWFWC